MKASFPKVKEMENGMIHLEPPPGSDQVTLCGITDWIGCEKGKIGVTAAVTCIPCRAIANYCQAHRKMREPRRRTSSISSTTRGYHDCAECSDGKRECTCGGPSISSPDRGGK